MAEKRATRMVSPSRKGFNGLFFSAVEHRVGVGVVVHLHLAVHLHVLAAGGDVVEQGVDGRGEVGTLFLEHGELGGAACAVLGRRVGALGFGAHVVDFERQDAEAVEGPRGALGVDGGVGGGRYAGVERAEVGVELLHHVGAHLVGAVDAALEGECGHGVDVRVADDVLEVPLHGVDVVFGEECVLDASGLEGVLLGGVDVVGLVVGGRGLREDVECALCERFVHIIEVEISGGGRFSWPGRAWRLPAASARLRGEP